MLRAGAALGILDGEATLAAESFLNKLLSLEKKRGPMGGGSDTDWRKIRWSLVPLNSNSQDVTCVLVT
ncbi:hypothetical protein STEG23_018013, partial [Scotinomys teguina]